jgi:hypothetical protein
MSGKLAFSCSSVASTTSSQLEHEDRDMMRPFVVMPPELVPFM